MTRRLWLALATAPAAFAVHLVATFWLWPAACATGSRLLLLLPTFVLAPVALAALVIALRLRQPVPAGAQPLTRDEARRRPWPVRFLAWLLLPPPRPTRPEPTPYGAPRTAPRPAFMRRVALYLDTLCVLVIVAVAAAAVFGKLCP